MNDILKVKKSECPFPPEFNKDGTMNYFSVGLGIWLLNMDDISSYDLKFFSEKDQKKILKFMEKNNGNSNS